MQQLLKAAFTLFHVVRPLCHLNSGYISPCMGCVCTRHIFECFIPTQGMFICTSSYFRAVLPRTDDLT